MLEKDLQRLQGIDTRLAGMSNKQAAFYLLLATLHNEVQHRVKLRYPIEIDDYATGFDAMVEGLLASLTGKSTFQWTLWQAQIGFKEGVLGYKTWCCQPE